jgi:hypothetical protein
LRAIRFLHNSLLRRSEQLIAICLVNAKSILACANGGYMHFGFSEDQGQPRLPVHVLIAGIRGLSGQVEAATIAAVGSVEVPIAPSHNSFKRHRLA